MTETTAEAVTPRRLRPAPPRGRRGPAPLSPDLRRTEKWSIFLTEEYSGRLESLAARLGLTRLTLFDLAMRRFAEAEGDGPLPALDPKVELGIAGPWLGGMAPADAG